MERGSLRVVPIKKIARLVNRATKKARWPAFIVSLVFLLVIAAMRLSNDWPAVARNSVLVGLFLAVALLVRYIDRPEGKGRREDL
jgi:protein-S-isoprenylcysteine O-methyltransferase Ste14